jgi:dTDP-4-dehydrorhamnose reductase
MTRILIIGANGMLGHVLMQWQQPGITIAGTLRGETPAPFSCLRDKQLFYGVECSDTQRLLEVFEQFRPNAVVNCAGLIKHRDEAVNTAQMIATNALFPHILAGLCRAHNTRLIQISTDCIFSGAQGPYTEQHRPHLHHRPRIAGEAQPLGMGHQPARPHHHRFRRHLI